MSSETKENLGCMVLVFVGVLYLGVESAGLLSNRNQVPTPKAQVQSPTPTPKAPYKYTEQYRQPPTRSFRGYECTDDCSGHEAGYEWAERKGITDPDDCSGKSESFIEGCKSYAEEQGYGGEDDSDDYDYQYLWSD